MRTALVLAFLLIQSCAHRAPPTKTKERSSFLQERDLKKFVTKEIPRKGKFSTVTDGDITTERYKRETGETILTLEKGELRTEIEKLKSGRLLTRTWHDGIMTSMMIGGSKRTTMIVLGKNGEFVQKIVTEKGKEKPSCFEYPEGRPVPMEESSCLGLLSGFE